MRNHWNALAKLEEATDLWKAVTCSLWWKIIFK